MIRSFVFRRTLLAYAGAAVLLAAHAASAEQPTVGGAAGLIVLMRHAEAPGTGDPPGFRLGDCETQRNLDDRGRAQARRMGERLRELGIRQARILSSQWCRCLETARLLGLGPVEELPALNSFFGRPEEQATKVAAVKTFLADLTSDGTPVVLVTHQVTVTALTGIYPASGEALLLRGNGTSDPEVLGALKDTKGR